MTGEEFAHHVVKFLDEVEHVIVSKNEEYADSDDALANFRETAEFLDCSMFESLLPHMYKHFRAIAKGFDDYSPGDLRDRLIDLCAYAIFTDIIKKETVHV